MGKPSKRTRDEADTYDCDGGFVSNDDGGAPKSKKTKKQASKKEDSEEHFWELSAGRTPRRVGISEFKGKKLVNMREFYEKDGNMLPGKKGISLTIEQYEALLAAIPEINASLRKMGVEVGQEGGDEDVAGEAKPQKKAKPKKEKANIEATSDEEEE